MSKQEGLGQTPEVVTDSIVTPVCVLIRFSSGTGSDLDSPLLSPAAGFFLSCQTRPGVGVAPAPGPESLVCFTTHCLKSLLVDPAEPLPPSPINIHPKLQAIFCDSAEEGSHSTSHQLGIIVEHMAWRDGQVQNLTSVFHPCTQHLSPRSFLLWRVPQPLSPRGRS